MLDLDRFKVTKATTVDWQFWNLMIDTFRLRIADIAARADAAKGASDAFVAEGLARFDTVLRPLYEHAAEVAGLGLAFAGTSASTLDLVTGPATLIVDEAARAGFAPTTFLYGHKAGDVGRAFVARLEGWDPGTGALDLTITHAHGAGSHAPWRLYPAVAYALGNALTIADVAGLEAALDGKVEDAALTALALVVAGKAAAVHAHAFGDLTELPDTLAGYGIADAYTRDEVDAALAALDGGTFS
jgi:hypothetical protein